MQTRKVTSFPVIMMGVSFWSPLIDWIRDSLLATGKISPQDVELVSVTDDPDEAVRIIVESDRRAGTQ